MKQALIDNYYPLKSPASATARATSLREEARMATLIALSKSSLQQQRDRLRLIRAFSALAGAQAAAASAAYKQAVQVLTEAEQGADQASR